VLVNYAYGGVCDCQSEAIAINMSSRWLCHGYAQGITEQGVSHGWQTYRWTGYSFLPTFCYQNWCNESFCVNTPAMVGAGSMYDHTNFWPSNESVFHWDFYCWCNCFCGTICHRFYDPFGSLVTSYSYSYNECPAPGYYSQSWFWVGWGVNNASFNEIWVNGLYCSVVTGGTTGLGGFTDYACVTNLDLTRLCRCSARDGAVWVEGDQLVMNSWGWKLPIRNDGGNYGSVGASCAGAIWYPHTGNYLEYIDQNGFKRRTHVGDKWGVDGYSLTGGSCNVGAGKEGIAWIRDFWAFMYFVNCSGDIIRLGAGYVYGNGP